MQCCLLWGLQNSEWEIHFFLTYKEQNNVTWSSLKDVWNVFLLECSWFLGLLALCDPLHGMYKELCSMPNVCF